MKKNEGGSVYPHRLLKTGDEDKDLNYGGESLHGGLRSSAAVGAAGSLDFT